MLEAVYVRLRHLSPRILSVLAQRAAPACIGTASATRSHMASEGIRVGREFAPRKGLSSPVSLLEPSQQESSPGMHWNSICNQISYGQ